MKSNEGIVGMMQDLKPLPSIQITPDRWIGDDQPCFIIAEVGQNHNGDVAIARELIDNIAFYHADSVKLCKRDIASDLTRAAYDQPYYGPQSFGETYGKHREALELSRAEYEELKAYATSKDVLFFASACDMKSVDFLEEVGVPLYKVASRDLDNWPLLETLAETGKPLIVSTGMAKDDHEIEAALNVIRAHHERIILLYCVSEYPTPDNHVHLARMLQMRCRHGLPVGFSDHTIGIHLAEAAVAVGACLIEKHVTLARAMPGTDHAASLEPAGMQRLVRNIRAIETSLNRDRLWYHPEVERARAKLGRSLVSRRPIRPGEEITEEMVSLKSPGTGVHWPDRHRIVGRIARVHVPANVTLQASDVTEIPETD